MTGEYLTLDLRELNNTIDTLYKKGIYKYFINISKKDELSLGGF